MKYKFLALGGHKELRSIKEELNQTNVDFEVAGLNEIEIFISTNQVHILVDGKDILEFDYTWLTSSWSSRSIAYAVSLYLRNNGMQFSSVEEEGSKLVDMMLFGFNGISLPDTYFTMTHNIQDKLEPIVKTCSYPFIVKTVRGSLGDDIYLINSEKEFFDLVPKLKKKRQYICQRFIPNDFDYRIIIAKGEVVSAVKRVRKTDSFRNNTYLGAEEFFISPSSVPENVINLAKLSADCLDLNWSGVDIVTCSKSGESYVLESNRRPGLTPGSSEISAAYDHIVGIRALNGG